MKLKRWIAIWCVILLISAGVAVYTRQSLVNCETDLSKMGECIYFYSSLNKDEMELDIDRFIEDSQLIITGKLQGSREVQYQVIRSEMQVERVIKGDKRLEGQTITVYEPIFIRDHGKSLSPTWKYCILNNDTTYLMFLSPQIFHEKQRLSDEDKRTFVFSKDKKEEKSCDYVFSRISLEQGLQPAQFISAEERVPLSGIGASEYYMDAQTAVWYAEICNQLIEACSP